MENIVIVFGANTINALGMVRSLGEAGIYPVCILLNTKSGLVYDSKYPIETIYKDSVEGGLSYIVSHFSKEKMKAFILSSDDRTSSIIDTYYYELIESFYIPNAGADGVINYYMDKNNLSKLAASLGFDVPQTVVIDKKQTLPEDIPFPCFLKPVASIKGTKKEPAVCLNAGDVLEKIKIFSGDDILLQEYVDKKTELCFQGFSINRGEEIFIPYVMRYFRFIDTSFGGYVCLDKFSDQKLFDKIHHLIQKIQYTGLFSVEFLLGKNGVLYFTEINFRHDGYSYFTTTGGANLPYLYIKSVLNGRINTADLCIKEKVVGMNELVDFSQFVVTGKLSLLKWFYQFSMSNSHLLFNFRDIFPSCKLIMRWCIYKFRKR